MINKENQKKFWRIFGCFIGILVFFLAVLIGMIKLSEKKWDSGLKQSVQNVLDEKYPDAWTVGNSIPLNSPFSTSANLFEARSNDSAEKYYAIIIRITTLYGHMPAVFVYNNAKGAEFIGYSAVHGRIKKLLEENYADSSISYWLERLPSVIQEAEKVERSKK
ncbi:MAG: hypothetical protein UIB61_03335 [Treponema sp.]|jgi:hypothetical protein|nr:hypothetical protein [Treponema sp.]